MLKQKEDKQSRMQAQNAQNIQVVVRCRLVTQLDHKQRKS